MFKGYAERFLLQNETNKITDAKELMDAVMSNGGPVNTTMCVAVIDQKKQSIKTVRNVPNISTYHTVVIGEEGARYLEFFQIGNGKLHELYGKS